LNPFLAYQFWADFFQGRTLLSANRHYFADHRFGRLILAAFGSETNVSGLNQLDYPNGDE
jgi:hypothetical protein